MAVGRALWPALENYSRQNYKGCDQAWSAVELGIVGKTTGFWRYGRRRGAVAVGGALWPSEVGRAYLKPSEVGWAFETVGM